jgi:hypothetical protein
LRSVAVSTATDRPLIKLTKSPAVALFSGGGACEFKFHRQPQIKIASQHPPESLQQRNSGRF